MILSTTRSTPISPAYRWECQDCDEWQVVHATIRRARRMACDHVFTTGHEVTILRIAEWWQSVPPDPHLHGGKP